MVYDKYDIESMKCPKCAGDNHYINNCDEKQFDYDGTGHVIFDHTCEFCGETFRSYTRFKYEIIEQRLRK